MAKKKNNLMDLNESELKTKLATLQSEVLAIKFKAQGAKSKNVKDASFLKKNIARVLTQLNRAKGQTSKSNKNK